MNTFHKLRDRIAVVGVGNTAYGNFPHTDDYGLGAEAFRRAIADCGLDKNQVDGLGVCRVPYYARMGEILGLAPRWTVQFPRMAACRPWRSSRPRRRWRPGFATTRR